MNEKTKAVLAQARELSRDERLELVDDLLDTLNMSDPAVDRLWAREARERLEAFRRQDIAAKDLREVLAKYHVA